MRIKLDKIYKNGKSKNPNTWVLDFFPYGDNSGVTTITIVSLLPQKITISNGLFNNGLNTIDLVPNAIGVISFTFTAIGKGQIVFSNKESIRQLGQLIIGTSRAPNIFTQGDINSPCVNLDLQKLPENIEGFTLGFKGKNASRTFVNQSYNELVKYSNLKGFVLGNPYLFPVVNFTSLSLDNEQEQALSFVYIENVYTEKKLDGDITQRTAPVNDNFFINPILTKNAKDFIFFNAIAKVPTDNKNVVKGKLKDFGNKPWHIEWFNSNLIEGKISDMKLTDVVRLDIGGSKIKGYDAGKIINDFVNYIDISRTAMSDLDTDKFLIDLNNSLVTNLRRTLKIKARTSSTDSIVSQLITKGVVLE